MVCGLWIAHSARWVTLSPRP